MKLIYVLGCIVVRGKTARFLYLKKNKCCMPLKVTPMVCTFNLCSPPTKIKKSRFSVKQVKNRTGSTILRGKTARFTFFFNNSKSYRSNFEYEPAKERSWSPSTTWHNNSDCGLLAELSELPKDLLFLWLRHSAESDIFTYFLLNGICVLCAKNLK